MNILREEYLDINKGIQSDILNTTRFDEDSDLSTTYLGKSDRSKNDKIKAEESFPISEKRYTLGKLLDGTECQEQVNLSCQNLITCVVNSLHSLPKFASKTQRIQVGNGQFVSVLFMVPVIMDMHGYRFKIYTLISETYEKVDLVLGIKNVFELEGVINLQDCCLKFLNRSLPIFPKEHVILKPKGLAEFVCLLYVPYFLQTPLPAATPGLDRDFYVDLEQYRVLYYIYK